MNNNSKKQCDIYKNSHNCLCTRLLAFFGVLSVCFTLMLSTINFDNVSASSTSFIQSSDYNISLGGLFTSEASYDVETPYNIITPIGDHFISIIKNSNDDYTLELNYTSTSSTGHTDISTLSLSRIINSQRYKFVSNRSFYMSYISFEYNNSGTSLNKPYYSRIKFNSIEVLIPIQYATNVDNMFNNLNCCRYLFYRAGNNECNLNLVFANSMSTFDDPVMTVYFTFADDFPEPVSSHYLYNSQVVRIDRSGYIKEDVVYVNPFTNLLASISNGVTNFMSIEIFPNFTFGTIISLVLGIALFSLLLHLIIK